MEAHHCGVLFSRLSYGRQLIHQDPGKVPYKNFQIIIPGWIFILLENLSLQITFMSYEVPWDGVYRLENVHYPEQKIGLSTGGVIEVVGRRMGSVDSHTEWEISADDIGDSSKMTIKCDGRYIDTDYKRVTYNTIPHEWELSYRDVGRWTIRAAVSGLYMYLPDGDEGTRVQLMYEPISANAYWRLIPIRHPSK